MANRKSLFCNSCGNPLEDDGSCKMCPAGNKRRTSPTDKIDRKCQWNDHGYACGLVGSISDSTNGSGPWYCAKHYWKLKDYLERAGTGKHVTVRDQWYLDHKQEYAQANLDRSGKLKSIAQDAAELHQRLLSGELGSRQRQPGDDDEEVAA